MTEQTWLTYADAFAFLGNSLLKPMSQTEAAGIDPLFWSDFPCFDDEEVKATIADCSNFAQEAQERLAKGTDEVEAISIDYTKLFVGPPSPAAPPWETMNRGENITVGFGEPTFQMQNVLRDLGLEVSNHNNQYADHMGIELLVLSEMCRRVANDQGSTDQIQQFLSDHPIAWIDELQAKIHSKTPSGYYDVLVGLIKSLLESLSSCLANS